MLKQLVGLFRHGGLAGLALCCSLAAAPLARAQDAAALRARHATLHDALAANAFQRPLVIESSEPAGGLQGDVYARIEQPFAVVGQALRNSDHWCDILMLHLNVKQCRARDTPPSASLGLIIGSKYDQPLANAYRFEFAYQVVATRPDYLQVVLSADQGPLGTSHYRIVLEVVALDAGVSFLHMSYAYDYGVVARVAMEGYLATIGRSKVGFSVVGYKSDGQPQYIGSMRGVVERNTMRYYLAIEAYLGALSLPLAQQFERRLTDWFAGIERYPTQLHELELGEYLALKREQMQRQPARGQGALPIETLLELT
ncbi:hypothetical protein [Piscinibacter sp.]|uniref:hypothetical protein n=1 Tax=Piscinibacter sp. TaxID=1903157 RepID=UPI00355A84D9